MGFRFQKRLKLLNGLTLNLSKGLPSVTIGRKGAGLNISKHGLTGNAGIPGSGLSYREKLSGKPASTLIKPLAILLIIAFAGLLLGGGSMDAVFQNLLSIVKP